MHFTVRLMAKNMCLELFPFEFSSKLEGEDQSAQQH